MYIKLDKEVERLLCCSWCKSDLERYIDYFICTSCRLRFPSKVVKTDATNEEIVFDFRIHRPPYCIPKGLESWNVAQSEYEQYHESSVTNDSIQEYLDEIDSVREIYTVEYSIEGAVLDVGGHQGRLRHYLGTDVSLYVSVDPFIDIFSDMREQPNLLRAYPTLSEPCNFISAHAENLPFRLNSFDWIHMRSVVDHFADPYLAFLEAYRCAKVGGRLLVGLAILERRHAFLTRVAQKLKQEGVTGLVHAISKRLRHHTDEHIFRLTHSTLMDLYAKSGWDIVKEHWQKPPFQYCIYACGQKIESKPMAEQVAAPDGNSAELQSRR
jgi:ubiquinone/menaquinone biosynthesis C-methylase UbiE